MYTIATRRRRAVAVLVRVAVCAAAAPLVTPLAAQAPALGTIEGRLTDSLRAAPAAGAVVQAVRVTEPKAFASVFADDRGRFRLDSLTPGRYWLSFASATLDSLGITVPEQEVTVEPGRTTHADLGTPSAATLRAAVCPGVPLGKGQGGIAGVVSLAATERPMAGATVVVGWSDLSVDRATLRPVTTPRVGAVTSDSLGRYHLCGVPTDTPLELQVQHQGSASAVVNVVVRDSVGMLRQDLSFGADVVAEARADTGAVRGARLPAASGTASVTGLVTGVGGRPLSDVEVRIAGARGSARTDSLGRFALSGQPAGTQMLEGRHIGYVAARAPVELRSGRTVEQALSLTRVVSLDSVRIVAQRARYPEFERHRKNGFGRFLDESDILRRNPIQTSDLFRVMLGVRVVHRGFDDTIVSGRGSGCALNVIVDGMRGMDINMVHPSDIAAIEVYPSAAGVPGEYYFGSGCGAVVIWTKR